MIDDLGGIRIVNCEGGAPVVIARLPDRTGIDEVPGTGRDRNSPRIGFAASLVLRAKFMPVVVFLGETALQMRVADEGNCCGHLLKGRPRIAHAENVLVFVKGRAVGQGDACRLFWLERPLGNSTKPGEVIRGELIMGPDSGGPCDRIEAEG